MRRYWHVGASTRVSDGSPEVNLTPLIDVVLVILIMFIVVAPILEMDQVQLASGPGVETEKIVSVSESAPITIHVKQDNTVFLNSVPVGIEVLQSQLKNQKRNYPEATPQLFHDRKAHFGIYQQIKNAVEEAGFAELDVILLPSGKVGVP